jgi:hypothetical protein
MQNPTVVMITDRNDLDDQLFDEVFAPARTLPETPIQAESRDHLRRVLAERTSGGIVFSTMQKFGRTKPERDANREFPKLSERSNIVVIADEAHRTQYDLIDGLARNLRDALPKASFMGFTGTPFEAEDKDTRNRFRGRRSNLNSSNSPRAREPEAESATTRVGHDRAVEPPSLNCRSETASIFARGFSPIRPSNWMTRSSPR